MSSFESKIPYKNSSVLKDIEVIREIISSDAKVKIFLEVYKNTKPNIDNWISGYKLSKVSGLPFNSTYHFVDKKIEFGVFQRLAQVRGIKRVRITEYGIRIFEKIKSIIPIEIKLL